MVSLLLVSVTVVNHGSNYLEADDPPSDFVRRSVVASHSITIPASFTSLYLIT